MCILENAAEIAFYEQDFTILEENNLDLTLTNLTFFCFSVMYTIDVIVQMSNSHFVTS